MQEEHKEENIYQPEEMDVSISGVGEIIIVLYINTVR